MRFPLLRVAGEPRELSFLLVDLVDQLHAAACEVFQGDLSSLACAELPHDLCHRILHVQLPADHQQIIPDPKTETLEIQDRGKHVIKSYFYINCIWTV